MKLIPILIASTITACGGEPQFTDGYQPPEVTTQQHQYLSGIWHSAIFNADSAHPVTSFELSFGPSTGLCGVSYFGGQGMTSAVNDPDGSHSTGFVSTVAADGNWSVTIRAIGSTDFVSVAFNCIPWSAFSHGVPTRTGFGGVTAYGGTASAYNENAWTAFYVPMSVWGTLNDQNSYAGFTHCNSGILCMNVSTSQAGHGIAIQEYGYSWSPSTCSTMLGRVSSGSCIYVPNGQNATFTPVSTCDYVNLQPQFNFPTGVGNDMNAITTSGTIDTNATRCPGSANAFCYLADFDGAMLTNRTVVEVNQIGRTPQLEVIGDTTTMPQTPAPGAWMSCVETAF